jgi:hypothetical protein
VEISANVRFAQIDEAVDRPQQVGGGNVPFK